MSLTLMILAVCSCVLEALAVAVLSFSDVRMTNGLAVWWLLMGIENCAKK